MIDTALDLLPTAAPAVRTGACPTRPSSWGSDALDESLSGVREVGADEPTKQSAASGAVSAESNGFLRAPGGDL